MKILLDKNLPRLLKKEFGNSHSVFTVHDIEMGWEEKWRTFGTYDFQWV